MTNPGTESTAARDQKIPLGAHIVTPRLWYTHHGIYIGSGQVVHYEGLSSSLRRGRITKVSLVEFANGRPVSVCDDGNAFYSGIEIVTRACSRLGEDAYDLLRNNCEHLCSWCSVGAARSAQVDRLFSSSRAVERAARVLAVFVGGWCTARGALPLLS